MVVARECFPTGVLGYWARRLADDGLVAALTATSPPRLGHPDGGPPLAGTNPLAVAIPSSGGDPVVADVSMGSVTWGDVLAGEATAEELVPFGASPSPSVSSFSSTRSPARGTAPSCSSRGPRPTRFPRSGSAPPASASRATRAAEGSQPARVKGFGTVNQRTTVSSSVEGLRQVCGSRGAYVTVSPVSRRKTSSRTFSSSDPVST